MSNVSAASVSVPDPQGSAAIGIAGRVSVRRSRRGLAGHISVHSAQ
ncbi:hypothetical protein [Mastigocoleus testarum]|nr:hypothetical protein [Mastigocoleus testarum]